MGTKAADTLREIETLRTRLDTTLNALDGRLPPAAQIARRALRYAGGGAGAAVLLGITRRLVRRPKARPRALEAAGAASVVVRVVPVPVALAVAAVWAGVRLYETSRARGERSSAPVRALSSAGSVRGA